MIVYCNLCRRLSFESLCYLENMDYSMLTDQPFWKTVYWKECGQSGILPREILGDPVSLREHEKGIRSHHFPRHWEMVEAGFIARKHNDLGYMSMMAAGGKLF